MSQFFVKVENTPKFASHPEHVHYGVFTMLLYWVAQNNDITLK